MTMVNLMNTYNGIDLVHIDGIEELVEVNREMLDSVRRKNYDVLDFRKPDVSQHIIWFSQYLKFNGDCGFLDRLDFWIS